MRVVPFAWLVRLLLSVRQWRDASEHLGEASDDEDVAVHVEASVFENRDGTLEPGHHADEIGNGDTDGGRGCF